MAGWAQMNFQDGASPMMDHLTNFHDFTVLVLTLIISFVIFVIYGMAQKTYIHKKLSAHHGLEFIWTVLPVLVLISVAVPSLVLLFMMEDSSSAFISTKVVGYQWYWHYETFPNVTSEESGGYESYMINESGGSKKDLYRLLDTSNYLSAPVNVPMRVLITSGDVLHSWTVPVLGVKVDACPGRLNEVIMMPFRVGTFFGQCSEICGSNHSFMPIEVKVMSADFWLGLS